MKKLLLISAFVLAATSAHSDGFRVGVETDVNYTTEVEEWKAEITPLVGLGFYGMDFTIETTFDALKLDEDNIFKGVDLTAKYTIPNTGIIAYSEVSSDSDFEFGNITVGAKMKF